jgi:hypothetical protein
VILPLSIEKYDLGLGKYPPYSGMLHLIGEDDRRAGSVSQSRHVPFRRYRVIPFWEALHPPL